MAHRGPANPERAFGVSVGAVLCGVAAFLVWRGRIGFAEVLAGIGGLLLAAGLTRPSLLKWPSAVWWRVVYVLGYVNARIILTVLFAVILVPLGALWRISRKDPLTRRLDAWPGWSPYPGRYRNRRHYSRMY
jgi:hypothetical protein